MDDTIMSEWKKELRVLLDLVQSRPSADLDEQRDRIVVLQKLIAGRAQTADA
jgi:hypothetical protein